MVFFTCQKCNECLKKNAVVKHGQMSRKCLPFWLTCIDCLKDFRNDEHVQHTSCVTEEVRYGGKNAKTKPPAAKQNRWLCCVEKVLSTPQHDIKIDSLLKSLKGQTNLPRARNKFHNFVKSKYYKIYNKEVTDDVFTLMETEFVKFKAERMNNNSNANNAKHVDKGSLSADAENGHEKENSNSGKTGNESDKKEPKESKNLNEEEMNIDDQESHDQEINNKKRKLDCVEDEKDSEQSTADGPCSEAEKMDKKERKKRNKELKYLAELNEIENYSKEGDEEEDGEKPAKKSKKDPTEKELDPQDKLCKLSTEEPAPEKPTVTGFNWNQTIKAVLRNQNNIPLKRLKKIVINEYIQQFGEPHDEVKLSKKFVKKLKRINNVVVSGDKVMLEKQEA
ncbi:cell growth-regulating nucleolar protein [Cimex lectularius]|uniref:Cell growth-regulating nucleolar protein n=1 Tax=Cimex lectularius TaxID=79782 RepID=A0A8I6R9Z7_CIMLE|nr:cell growth-regulating nucleolar protein [Cimex lectularius]